MANYSEGFTIQPAWYSNSTSGNIQSAANLLGNGNFALRQRVATATDTLVQNASGKAACDRWSTQNSQGGYHSQRAWSSGGTHPGNAASVLRVAGNGVGSVRHACAQGLENVMTVPLRGQHVTLSGYIRFSSATLTGLGAVQAFIGFTNGTADASIQGTSYLANGSASADFTNGSFPTTWTFFSATVLVGASANNIAVVVQGTNLVTLSAANFFELSNVMLNVGSQPAPFQPFGGSFASDLAYCQRFYEKSYDVATVPATVANNGMQNLTAAVAGSEYENASFATRKRISPAMTTYSPATGTSGVARNYNTGADVATTFTTGGEARVSWGIAATDGANIGFHWTAEAEL